MKKKILSQRRGGRAGGGTGVEKEGKKSDGGREVKTARGIYRWWLMGNGLAGQRRKNDASPERGGRFPVAISPGML